MVHSLCTFTSLFLGPLLTDQRNLGMSMKVERSSLEDVKERFQVVKKKKTEEKKQYGVFFSQLMFFCVIRKMNNCQIKLFTLTESFNQILSSE